MKTREQKLIERDDALVKRERSIRFTRAAATCFAALMFFSFIVHSVHAAKAESSGADTASPLVVTTDAGVIDLNIPAILMCGFFFWAALAHEYNLRSRHIDSIKQYRRTIEESQHKPGA